MNRMRVLNNEEVDQVSGGILPAIVAGVSAYYGEELGKWLYKKLFK